MHLRGYLLVTLLIGVLAALFFVSPFLQGLFFIVADDTSSYAAAHTGEAMIFFVLLAAISAMILPFSSVPIVPFAVSLWGMWTTGALLLTGWLIGGIGAYMIGRYAAHPIIAQFMKEEKLTRYKHYVSDRLTFTRALLLRFSLPAEIGYAFGLIQYHFVLYIIVTIIAEVPLAFLTIQASDAFVHLEFFSFIGWIVALGFLMVVSYILFRRKRPHVA